MTDVATAAYHAIHWKTLLGVALSAKFALFGTGWIVWAVAAKTGNYRRAEFLGHVEQVLEVARTEGLVEHEKIVGRGEDIGMLRVTAEGGWHSADDLARLGRVLAFATSTHAKSTSEAMKALSATLTTFVSDWFYSYPRS